MAGDRSRPPQHAPGKPPPVHMLARSPGSTVQAKTSTRNAAIQLLTNGGLIQHRANPVTGDAHTHYEVYTGQWGADSDTANFVEFNNSEYLAAQDVKYGDTKIGTVSTQGVGEQNQSDPLVRMHLINSFLHPGANGWATNWIWGSHRLNSQHSQIETQVKNQHPANPNLQFPPPGVLNVETIVPGANVPQAEANTGLAFRNAVLANLLQLMGGAYLPGNNDNMLNALRIHIRTNQGGGPVLVNIANFLIVWAVALGQTATTRIEMNFRKETFGGGAFGAQTNRVANIPNDTYRLVYRPEFTNPHEKLMRAWFKKGLLNEQVNVKRVRKANDTYAPKGSLGTKK